MSNGILAAVLLPIVILVGLFALPPIVGAFVTTLQQVAEAYPPLAFAALIVSVGFVLFSAFKK